MTYQLAYCICLCHSITDCTNFPNAVFQIMTSRPRSDLYINLPALRKLDHMLLVSFSELRIQDICWLKKKSVISQQDLLTGNPGKLQRSRVLVCWARYCRTGLRWLCLLQGSFPPPWWEMVATGASCPSWRPSRQNKEAAPAQTWLCKSNLEGCHGNQQQFFSWDGGPWIVPRLPTEGIPCLLPWSKHMSCAISTACIGPNSEHVAAILDFRMEGQP